MTRPTDWTPEEATELLAMYERGDPLWKIAGTFGRTRRQIGLKLDKLGKTRKPYGKRWTPEEDAVVIAMRTTGATHKTISQVLGRSPSQCRHRAARLGLARPANRMQPVGGASADDAVKPSRRRACLKCGKTFDSTCAGNRMCRKCAKDNRRVFDGADMDGYRVANR